MKERLRMLLAESEPSKIRWRLADFYDSATDAQLPEATRLAETVQTWWPAILVALSEDASNARTEGFNRIIRQTKRVGCGYRLIVERPEHIRQLQAPRTDGASALEVQEALIAKVGLEQAGILLSAARRNGADHREAIGDDSRRDFP